MDQSPGLNGYGNWKIVTVQPCIFPPAQNVPEGSPWMSSLCHISWRTAERLLKIPKFNLFRLDRKI